jgi:hypothetical protein
MVNDHSAWGFIKPAASQHLYPCNPTYPNHVSVPLAQITYISCDLVYVLHVKMLKSQTSQNPNPAVILLTTQESNT